MGHLLSICSKRQCDGGASAGNINAAMNEAMNEAKTTAEVHRRFRGQVLRYTATNGVVKFDPASFDPDDPRHGRFEWQFGGNHFTCGITLKGFRELLDIMGWYDYTKLNSTQLNSERKRHKLSWLEDGEANGYDLTEVIIKPYMKKIGMQHLSLVEAIESEQVPELAFLKDQVGPADIFFSHVQQVPLSSMINALEGGPLTKYGGRRKRGHAERRFFIDYTGIRQWLNTDFTIERVVGAIETIGFTAVELRLGFGSKTHLFNRMFCLLELYATVKAKATLVPCFDTKLGCNIFDELDGWLMQHLREDDNWLRSRQLELREEDIDEKSLHKVIDSYLATCRWPEEEDKIRQYILQNGGFLKTDYEIASALLRLINTSW